MDSTEAESYIEADMSLIFRLFRRSGVSYIPIELSSQLGQPQGLVPQRVENPSARFLPNEIGYQIYVVRGERVATREQESTRDMVSQILERAVSFHPTNQTLHNEDAP
jgi:hypothetical protein